MRCPPAWGLGKAKNYSLHSVGDDDSYKTERKRLDLGADEKIILKWIYKK
jgi:hypothetical protein